jgi:hypothetical protein
MNITIAKKDLLRRLCCAALISVILPARAAVYDFALGDGCQWAVDRFKASSGDVSDSA